MGTTHALTQTGKTGGTGQAAVAQGKKPTNGGQRDQRFRTCQDRKGRNRGAFKKGRNTKEKGEGGKNDVYWKTKKKSSKNRKSWASPSKPRESPMGANAGPIHKRGTDNHVTGDWEKKKL